MRAYPDNFVEVQVDHLVNCQFNITSFTVLFQGTLENPAILFLLCLLKAKFPSTKISYFKLQI